MNAELILRAIGDSNSYLLERSENGAHANRWRFQWVALVAGMCIIAACVYALMSMFILPLRGITTPTPDNGPTDAKIMIMRINELDNEPLFLNNNIILLNEDFVPMSDDELKKYYNVNIPSEIFPGMMLQEQSPLGINGIFRNNTRGVYFDVHSFHYSSNNDSSSITVSLAKGKYPHLSILQPTGKPLLTSKVGNVEMIVAHYLGSYDLSRTTDLSDIRYAEFILDGNGYAVTCKNIEENTFVTILASLVEMDGTTS